MMKLGGGGGAGAEGSWEIKSVIAETLDYRPPNLREVYVPFTENIRNPTKRGQVATVYGTRLALQSFLRLFL